MRDTVLAGRILFSTIFIIASVGHFQQQTVDFATWRGVPLAGVLVPLSGVIGALLITLHLPTFAPQAKALTLRRAQTLLNHQVRTKH